LITGSPLQQGGILSKRLIIYINGNEEILKW
jgi:hypothetical protein